MITVDVDWDEWQRAHFGLTMIFHLARFIGVVNVSQPARNRKDNCFSVSQEVHTSASFILDNLAPGKLYPKICFEQTEIQVWYSSN